MRARRLPEPRFAAEPDGLEYVVSVLAADAVRMELLTAVAALGLPQGAIGAGFLRNAVWDALHRRPPTPPDTDVDVVWFDAGDASAQADAAVEQRLRERCPGVDWSVKNQARMHLRNDDAPYVSVSDAIARWPETATSVAVRLADGGVQMVAPHGVADLLGLLLRPTPAFSGARRPVFEARVAAKGWTTRWPGLRLLDA